MSICFVPTQGVIENPKKIAKKLKNHILAWFEAKIVRKRTRRRENKSYRFVSFLPDAKEKMQKKKPKKLKKLKNTIMESFQAKIVWKRPRKRENKNYRFVSFLPDA